MPFDMKSAMKEAMHELGIGKDSADAVALQTEVTRLTTENTKLTGDVTKLTNERDELLAKVEGYRKTETDAAEAKLKTAREDCYKAAVTAKGQTSPDLEAIKTKIEKQTDLEVLATFTDGYKAEVKNSGYSNISTRTTSGTNPATEADDADLFAQIRKDGQAANGTAAQGA